MKKKSQILYGRHILKEAVAANIPILTIWVETKSAYDFAVELLGSKYPKIQFEEGIPPKFKNEVHQGVVFQTTYSFYLPYSIEQARKFDFVILCNHLENIQNLGSIARCAAAFGASLIIHENKRSASMTMAAVKSSAGCAFKLNFMEVDEISSVAELLRKSGYLVAGLDAGKNSIPLYDWQPRKPIALVLGSESDGIEEIVRVQCSELIRIPMENNVESLNVSHAASIVMSWVKKFSKKS
ncbi:MAG: RNA methyltransferase [Deltaproteobacteria bacterium]|nr:RNA methyltransferase [Deltaproteobacteria bacterium]